MGRYAQHKEEWKNCDKCDLCNGRNKVVLAKGKIPCDVLFIGEAPGVSEDLLEQPFIGPAGKLLEAIIQVAEANTDYQPRKLFTNLVACIPKDEEGEKIHQPKSNHIKKCSPRLVDIFNMSQAKAVVCVGSLSSKWSKKILEWDNFTDITHPSNILRKPKFEQNIAIDECSVALESLFESLKE